MRRNRYSACSTVAAAVALSLLIGCPPSSVVDDGTTTVEPSPGQGAIDDMADSVPSPVQGDEVPDSGGIPDAGAINPQPPALGQLFPGQAYRVGKNPVSLTSGDLDGDGDLDLAVANLGSNNVSILLGNGNGAFSTPVNYRVGNQPTTIEIGDLDGDGDLDLAVLNSDFFGGVAILRNNGDGLFAAAENIDVGPSPSSIALDDLDDDGDLDLAVGNQFDDNVSILLNDGDGIFAAADDIGQGAPSRFLTTGDLDGDGDSDLVMGFETELSDLDGDGDLDLAMVGDAVEISLSNGDGTFSAALAFSAQPLSDGIPVRDGVAILLNNGDGTFAAAMKYQTGQGPTSVTTGDWDNDGDLDLAVANFQTSDISILLNNGDGTFLAAVNLEAGGLVYSVGDLDGDGDLDLAVLSGTSSGIGNLSISLNNGNGTFTAPATIAVGLFLAIFVTSGDLDGDGDLDLVATVTVLDDSAQSIVAAFNGVVSISRNHGDGTFAEAVDFKVGVGSSSSSVAIGDLDGDGNRDLALTANSFGGGVASILLNNGEGIFSAAVDYPVGDQPLSIDACDLDGDGDLDLAVANSGDVFGSVSILLNNGDATFAAAVNYGTRTFPRSVVIGDFDGDGYQDLAVGDGNRSVGFVSILLNNGDGTFAAAVDFGTGVGKQNFVATGDLDGDGNLDLAVSNQSDRLRTGSVSVLLGNGDGTFAEAMNFVTGAGASSVGMGDLDGDGDLDLAVPNGVGVSILLNQLIE